MHFIPAQANAKVRQKMKCLTGLSVMCVCICARFTQVWLLTVLWLVSRGRSDECGANEEQTVRQEKEKKKRHLVHDNDRQTDCHTPVRWGKKIAVQSSPSLLPWRWRWNNAAARKKKCSSVLCILLSAKLLYKETSDLTVCVWVSVIRKSVERARKRVRGREWQNKHSGARRKSLRRGDQCQWSVGLCSAKLSSVTGNLGIRQFQKQSHHYHYDHKK